MQGGKNLFSLIRILLYFDIIFGMKTAVPEMDILLRSADQLVQPTTWLFVMLLKLKMTFLDIRSPNVF